MPFVNLSQTARRTGRLGAVATIREEKMKSICMTTAALAALLLSGCATYRAHEARTNNETVVAQMKADLAMCTGNPLLTTHVMQATCANAIVSASFAKLIPPQELAAARLNALRLRLAEQEDAGKITPGQAAEQMASLAAEIQAEDRQAIYQQQQIQAQQKPQSIFLYNLP